jgi:vitamin B12 transporter
VRVEIIRFPFIPGRFKSHDSSVLTGLLEKYLGGLTVRKKTYCLLLIGGLMLSPSFGYEGGEKKQSESRHFTVTVTANRLDTSLKEVASSLTVITREELLKTKKILLIDALREIPGVSVIQSGPPGSAAAAMIRGSNSEHTKVLLDGLELNDPITPSRSCDLGLLLVENIERIEILRGPQSTLYGSDAMAGVIHIISRRGEEKAQILFSSEMGSKGRKSAVAELSGRWGRMSFAFGAAASGADGISAAASSYEGNKERDGFQNNTLSVRVGYHPVENFSIHYSLRYINTHTEIDNFGGDFGDDPNSIQDYNALLMNAGFRGFFLHNRWEQKLNLSLTRFFRMGNNPVDLFHPFESDRSEFNSGMWKIDWQNNFYLHQNTTLTVGLEHQEEQGESEYHSESLWGSSTSLFPRTRARITGAYAQNVIRIKDVFFASAGVRMDHHNQFGTSWTFRLAPSLYFRQTGTKLKATYGTAFKAPSLYQLYAPGSAWGPVGNRKLNPEKSKGWDVGIEQYFFSDTCLLSATYFFSAFKDLIFFDFVSGYVNIGRARSRGMEIFCRVYPFPEMSLSATYTRTEARDLDEDIALLRRPKDKMTAVLDWNVLNRGQVSLSLIHTGARQDVYFSGWTAQRVTLPGFTLIHALFAWDLHHNMQIFCRMENILNKEYEWIKGYGTQGFSLYGGFRIRH